MKEKAKTANKKRSPGEASYRKRANGEWEGRITFNYKPYSVYGKLRADCVRKIAELKDKLQVGVSAKMAPTLYDWMSVWLTDHIAVKRKITTAENYETIAKIHIYPDLGRIRIDKLKPHEIQRLISKKQKAGLAPRTVRLIHHVIRCCLNYAVRMKQIVINPAVGASLPQVLSAEMATLSAADMQQLRAADLMETEPLFPCIILMAFTGLRRGEALPLRLTDFDMENCNVAISRELVKVKGGTKLQPPKTKLSNRLIPFGSGIRQLLLDHLARLELTVKKCNGFIDQGLMFPNESGGFYYPDSIRKILRRILRKVGIGPIRVHDLRHTCATLLMVSGVSAKVVQEILGHSRVSITLDVYSHTMPSLKRGAIDQMADYINATPPTKGDAKGNPYPDKHPEEISNPCLSDNLEVSSETPILH